MEFMECVKALLFFDFPTCQTMVKKAFVTYRVNKINITCTGIVEMRI